MPEQPPTLQVSAPVLTIEPDGRIHGSALTRVIVRICFLSGVIGAAAGALGGALVRLL